MFLKSRTLLKNLRLTSSLLQSEYVYEQKFDSFVCFRYLSILVCIFGSIANVLNIFVLSRREMRSPTNAILTGLAVADLLVMLEYIPFSCHVYLDPSARFRPSYFSYSWAVFTVFHALFTQVNTSIKR